MPEHIWTTLHCHIYEFGKLICYVFICAYIVVYMKSQRKCNPLMCTYIGKSSVDEWCVTALPYDNANSWSVREHYGFLHSYNIRMIRDCIAIWHELMISKGTLWVFIFLHWYIKSTLNIIYLLAFTLAYESKNSVNEHYVFISAYTGTRKQELS